MSDMLNENGLYSQEDVESLYDDPIEQRMEKRKTQEAEELPDDLQAKIERMIDSRVDARVESKVQAAMAQMQKELKEMVRQETAKAAPPPNNLQSKRSPPRQPERPYIEQISVTRGGNEVKGGAIVAEKKKTMLKPMTLKMQGG